MALGLGLGLQFRRNVGSRSFIDQFGQPAAAYSLRDLSGSNPNVIRVRRSSDNAEQDFTPSEITDGTLLSFVNGVNLLTYSNQFDTDWSISGTGTLTSGQSGYDGSSDAWLLTKSASSTYLIQNTSLSGINTFSVYAKAGTNTHLAFWIRNANQGKFFDLVNGTIGSDYINTPIDATIESVGNGWYRCSVTTNDASNNCRIYPADGDGDVSGTSGSIYIQDAQLELGSTVTTYTETTDAPAGYGYVTTWYDQAGSNDATQGTAANQPKIVDAGSLVTDNDKPSISFDGIDDEIFVPSSTSTFKFLHDGTSSSIFASVRFGNTSNPNESYGYLGTTSASSAQVGVSLGYDDRTSSSKNNAFYAGIFKGGGFAALMQDNDQITPNELKLLSTFLDADNTTLSDRIKIGVDGANLVATNTFSATASTANSTKNLHIGSFDGVAYLEGVIQELILYPSDQSSNRTGIENNINEYYSIY